ncbi:hypothetical protein M9458_006569, partial [Cirrhinus mrigala]
SINSILVVSCSTMEIFGPICSLVLVFSSTLMVISSACLSWWSSAPPWLPALPALPWLP